MEIILPVASFPCRRVPRGSLAGAAPPHSRPRQPPGYDEYSADSAAACIFSPFSPGVLRCRAAKKMVARYTRCMPAGEKSGDSLRPRLVSKSKLI